eukprot:8960-Heterococcus_DN1.PRE.3
MQFRPQSGHDYPHTTELLQRASAASSTGGGASTAGGYDTWYPPLRIALILSKIYRVADLGMFEDLAAAAVTAVLAAAAEAV